MEDMSKKDKEAIYKAAGAVTKGQFGWSQAAGKNITITFPTETTTVVNIIEKSSRAAQVGIAKAKVALAVKHIKSAKTAAEAATSAAEIAKTAEKVQKAAGMFKTAAIRLEAAKSATKSATPRAASILRLDTPHRGTEYNHININEAISGIPDPHLKIPAGALDLGAVGAYVCKGMNKVNKVAVPVAIVIDTVQVGYSVYNDLKNESTRNTIETVASVAGGWGGGYGGALLGVAIGTAIFPGVGTIIGGIVGGLSGGVGGSYGAGAAVNAIGDACDYDIDEETCIKCRREFKVRRYLGQNDQQLCLKCA